LAWADELAPLPAEVLPDRVPGRQAGLQCRAEGGGDDTEDGESDADLADRDGYR